MTLLIILIVVGFVALIYGANWLVDGSSALAKKYNVSDLIIGLTIVSFGTSAPELVVNTIASFNQFNDIVMGNIIGSNNFNLFIVLGLTGLIYPMRVQPSTVWKEIPISFIAALVLLLIANDFFIHNVLTITRVDGFILLLGFIAFLYYIFKQMKKEQSKQETLYKHKSNIQIWGLIIVGLTGLILGGKLVVDNGVALAELLGVSEKIIGLTILAMGTSLPELITSVIAATKRNTGIAIGNVIGSNIFNILFILSISSLVSPVAYNIEFNTDLYIFLGGTLFLFAALAYGKKYKLVRWQSALLFFSYIGYTGYLVWLEM